MTVNTSKVQNAIKAQSGKVRRGFVGVSFAGRLSSLLVIFTMTAGILSGCSTMEDVTDMEMPDLPSIPKFSNPFAKKEAKLPGERISVMTATGDGMPELDVSAATQITALPAVYANTAWTQPGGKPDNAMGHLAYSGALHTKFSVDAGRGSNKRSRVVASPIVYGGRIFTLDSRGRVTAFSQSGGSKSWSLKLTPATENDYEGYGGGLAVDEGRLLVATGFGKIFALDPSNGREIWVKNVGEPVRTSPTATGGKVFMTTVLGSFICLNALDGSELWRYQGLPESASLLTNASPAVADGIVVAPYPSGELVAFDITSGQPVWTETLSRSRHNSSLNSLRNASRPVIANGVVYAVGNGGRMIATSLKTGEQLWVRNVQGFQAPWIAGGTVYVVDIQGNLMAFTAKGGKMLWQTKLPGGGKWAGPVLAGGKLWLVSTKGMMVGVDGKLGSVLTKKDIGVKMTIAPVVANGKMYVLTSKAKLIAFN